MAEDIFDTNPPANQNPPEDPNAKLVETLNGLSEKLDGVTSRLDNLETQNAQGAEDEDTEDAAPTEGWKPETWDDIPEVAQQIAEDTVNQAFEERQVAAEEAKAQEAENQKQIDTYIDSQIKSLEDANVIPKVVNMQDENDPGRAARRELFGLAARLGTMDLSRTQEVIDVLHKTGQRYDPRANNGQGIFLRGSNTPLPGASAPVASSSGSSGFSSQGPTYKDIHQSRSLDDIVRREMGE